MQPLIQIDFWHVCRHQLLPDDDLGPLYDLLIDDPAEIRHAIGALVYDHLIAQKFNSSQSGAKGSLLSGVHTDLDVLVISTRLRH